MMNRVNILKEHWPKEIRLDENVRIKKFKKSELDEMTINLKGIISKVALVSEEENPNEFTNRIKTHVEEMTRDNLYVEIQYGITTVRNRLVNSAFIIGRVQ